MSGVQTRKGRKAAQPQQQQVPVVQVVPPARKGRGTSASQKTTQVASSVSTAAKTSAVNTTAHGTVNSVSSKKGKSKTGKSKKVQSNQPIVQQTDDGIPSDLDDSQNTTHNNSTDESVSVDDGLDDETLAMIAESDIQADEKSKQDLLRQLAVINKRQRETRKIKQKVQERNVSFVTPRTPDRESRLSRRPQLEETPNATGARELGIFDVKQDLETFLLRFEHCSERFKWKSGDRKFYMQGALMDHCSFILKMVGPEARCADMIKQLRINFGTDKQYKSNLAALNNRRRKKGEKLSDFYLEMCKLRANVTRPEKD